MEIKHVKASEFNNEVLKADKPVLVDFWADWCGPCKMLGPVLEQVAAKVDDVQIVKINVDGEPMSRLVSMVLIYGICLLQIPERSLLISRGNIVSSIFYEYGNGERMFGLLFQKLVQGIYIRHGLFQSVHLLQKSGDFHQESISLRIIRG